MRDVDGDSQWLVRAHHWLVLGFLLGGASACMLF
ncbi:hypothetical protein SAMN05428950_1011872 [Sphingomonas sp. OV641]|nr:hypothetical protein SAMN05428950_1011872 [Sphingomonas sp. OV641]